MKPARAKARALWLLESESSLETGGWRRDVDWCLLTGLDLQKLNHPLPDILAPVLSVNDSSGLNVDIGVINNVHVHTPTRVQCLLLVESIYYKTQVINGF